MKFDINNYCFIYNLFFPIEMFEDIEAMLPELNFQGGSRLIEHIVRNFGGFLGDRYLREIQDTNNAYLERINGSYEEIADRMQTFIDFFGQQTNSKSEREAFLTEGDVQYKITYNVEDCKYPCHLMCGGVQTNQMYTVVNLNTGEGMIINPLLIDMVRDHNFLEPRLINGKENFHGATTEFFYEHFMPQE